MEENKTLRQVLVSASQICKRAILGDIRHNELKIASIQGNKCLNAIREASKDLTPDGTFDYNAVWKLKKKLFPKCSDNPFAVRNSEKQLVTNSAEMINVMNDEFTHRLGNRIISDEYSEL